MASFAPSCRLRKGLDDTAERGLRQSMAYGRAWPMAECGLGQSVASGRVWLDDSKGRYYEGSAIRQRGVRGWKVCSRGRSVRTIRLHIDVKHE